MILSTDFFFRLSVSLIRIKPWLRSIVTSKLRTKSYSRMNWSDSFMFSTTRKLIQRRLPPDGISPCHIDCALIGRCLSDIIRYQIQPIEKLLSVQVLMGMTKTLKLALNRPALSRQRIIRLKNSRTEIDKKTKPLIVATRQKRRSGRRFEQMKVQWDSRSGSVISSTTRLRG